MPICEIVFIKITNTSSRELRFLAKNDIFNLLILNEQPRRNLAGLFFN